MKKLLSFACLLYTSITFGQITLEHSYPLNVNCVQISPTEWNYYTNNDSIITIYDITHSLLKTIEIPSMPNFYYGEVSNLSTNLFNTDSYYEYATSYFGKGGQNFNQVRFVIYNELGTILLRVDSATEGGVINTSNGIKLIVNSIRGSQGSGAAVIPFGNIYSLGGNYLAAIKPINKDNFNQLPYPNPSASYIHLTYNLPSGSSTGEMVVLNNSGQVIHTYSIGNAFSDILFNTKQCAHGIYYYYVQSSNYKSETNKFIIQ